MPDPADDGTTVERWRFGRCDRAQMEMLRIEGGGHSWPGSQFSGDDHCLDIDATREITDFWRSHAALGG
jgi:poly(3-hydroxybutyrate) depolymerase